MLLLLAGCPALTDDTPKSTAPPRDEPGDASVDWTGKDRPYGLTDEQWEEIQPSFKPDPSITMAGGMESGRLVGVLAAHNEVRSGVGVSPLAWSDALAAHSQEWAAVLAEECGTSRHRPNNRFGENIGLVASALSPPRTTVSGIVKAWASEVMCWEYGPISREMGCDYECAADLHSTGCGHYTQVVWSETTHVGCAVAQCTIGQFIQDFWVCNYYPHGNWDGELPY